MRLELRHLAPYLPYSVKFQSEMDKPFDEYGHQPTWTAQGVSVLFGSHCIQPVEANDAYTLESCRLALRPLSDLTKEIEHNGEKFVPASALKILYLDNIVCSDTGVWLDQKTEGQISVLGCGAVRDSLAEWHFDIYGLIPAGLAIDINTLKGGEG